MTERDHDDSNLEQRLRDHYQHRYEQPPDPTMVWARVLPHLDRQEKNRPGLMQQAKWLPGFIGHYVARQKAALKYLHEEPTFMQDELNITQTEAHNARSTRGKQSLRRRVVHMAEASIAALLVGVLLLSWFAIARSHSALGTASDPLFTYTSQRGENIYYPEWTPDRQYLTFMVCGNQAELGDGCRYQVWDAATGRMKQTLKLGSSSDSSDGGVSITDSPDGRYSFIVTWDSAKQIGTIKLVNIFAGQMKQIYQGSHYSDMPVTAISHDSKSIAVVGGDGYIRIWDTATGKLAQTIDPIGVSGIQQIGWSTDDTRIFFSALSGGANGVQVWNVQTGQRLASIVETSTMSLPYFGIDGISPDGQRVLTDNQQTGTFVVRDSSTLKVLQTLHGQLHVPANSYAMPVWLAGGTRVLLKQNQQGYIWNAMTGQLVSSFSLANVHNVAGLLASASDGEGQYISCLQQGSQLKILDVLTGKTARTISLIGDPQQISWLSGDQYLSIVDQNGQEQIYNALTGQLVLSYQGNEAAVSSDGSYLAVSDGLANRPGSTTRSTLQVFALH